MNSLTITQPSTVSQRRVAVHAVHGPRWWNARRRRKGRTATAQGEEDPKTIYEFGDGMAWPGSPSQRLESTQPSTSTSAMQSVDEECDEDTFTAAMTEINNSSGKTGSKTARRFPGSRQRQPRQQPRFQLPTAHEALDLLRERLSSGSMPSQRKDPFKLGLVVEGGGTFSFVSVRSCLVAVAVPLAVADLKSMFLYSLGMRGCVSGGALQAISDLGLRDAFDTVYGSSAGAINSTYFLSGQRQGVDIYHEHIASTEFIDLKRLLSSKPGTPAALNLEFLLEEVMENVLPLDVDAVLTSPIPLKVVASSLDSLSPVLLENFESKYDLIQSLRASACVPKVAGNPVHHRNHRLVDAAVFEAVPFRSAIADGCTHAIVLCTRPMSRKRSTFGKVLEATIKRAVLNPDYMQDAWAASVEYLTMNGLSHDEMLLRALEEDAHERYSWFAGAHVLPLYPDARASTFSPLCTDVETLKLGVAEGRRMIVELVKAADLPVPELPAESFGLVEDSNIQAFRAKRRLTRK